MAEIPLLGQSRAEEPKTPEVIECDTAFLVYIKDGDATASPDINLPVTTQRKAKPADMLSGAAQTTAIIQAQLNGNAMMAQVAQMGMQAREAQLQQQVMAQMEQERTKGRR